MIIATIRVHTDEEHRQELLQTFGSLYQPISRERGCLGCRFYSEIGNVDSMLLVEEWESEWHWKNHLQSKEFAVILGAMSLVKDPKAVEFKLLGEAAGVDMLRSVRLGDSGSFL